ncbi:hypothetical protein BU14_0103s0044 [Porphyra umbilicalis]|uniref:Uncharacterized protein n=1 Tax=Porphyra umbilicalis TaxID=2786 RepID=A0A1X6PCU5_PORUM|nr:hypothetical protein BU14_0103s0044 [Porphyra umbilicalis]|eukprot:OSX78701.1 hypothetical protein BU14_0103s0044 [Porphyra umbilicalis]
MVGTAAAHGGLAAHPLRAATHVQGGGGGALTVSAPWRAALPGPLALLGYVKARTGSGGAAARGIGRRGRARVAAAPPRRAHGGRRAAAPGGARRATGRFVGGDATRRARGGRGGDGALSVWRRDVPALAVRHCRRRVLMAKRWWRRWGIRGTPVGGGRMAADGHVRGTAARGGMRSSGRRGGRRARVPAWWGTRPRRARCALAGVPSVVVGGPAGRHPAAAAATRGGRASAGGIRRRQLLIDIRLPACVRSPQAPLQRTVPHPLPPTPSARRRSPWHASFPPPPSGLVGVPRHPPRCPRGHLPAGVGRCGPPTASRRRRLAPARPTRSPAPFGRPPPGANAPGFTTPTPPVHRRRGRSGDAVTYLCCVDPSLGFCAPVGVEHTRWGEVCTYNWRALDGGFQCCFRAADGRAEGPLPGGVFGGTRPPPRLTVVCRRVFKSCAPARAAAAAAAPPAASLPATRPARVGVEVAGRCGSWDGATYTKCEVLECPTRGRAGRGKVRLTACQLWGTPAQCCMEHKEWWRRNQCCRKCRVPGRRPSSMGCCFPGTRPGRRRRAAKEPTGKRTAQRT